MSGSSAFASAPGKVILLGKHGVNRQQPALATAVGLRAFCRATPRPDKRFGFCAGPQSGEASLEGLQEFRAEIDAIRRVEDFTALRAITGGNFFAPVRYVLAHMVERENVPGLDLYWRTGIPIGSGLGSGAAAAASMVVAVAQLAGWIPHLVEVAHLAWQGDIIAHGVIASGLDSGACSLGGLIRYTLAEGPQPLPLQGELSMVIGDTQIRANTSDVNTRVREGLEERPSRAHLFPEMGLLERRAEEALETGDLVTLGQLMNLNQLLLEKLGVSSAEIDHLVEAALASGAMGAKLSGSGGGGIIIALTESGREKTVAAAIDAAGGRSIITGAGAPGAHVEDATTWASLAI